MEAIIVNRTSLRYKSQNQNKGEQVIFFFNWL